MLKKEEVIAYLKSTGIFSKISYHKATVETAPERRDLNTINTDENGYHYDVSIHTYKSGATYVSFGKWTPVDSQMICHMITDMDFIKETVEYIKRKIA